MESVFRMSSFMENVTKVRLMIIKDLCNEEWTNTSKTKSNYWLSSKDQVAEAEILQALHFASNYWFCYCTIIHLLVISVISDFKIAKNYHQQKPSLSINCIICKANFDQWCQQKLDETMTSQWNSMMGSCCFGLKDTMKSLMLNVVFCYLVTTSHDQFLEHFQTFIWGLV